MECSTFVLTLVIVFGLVEKKKSYRRVVNYLWQAENEHVTHSLLCSVISFSLFPKRDCLRLSLRHFARKLRPWLLCVHVSSQPHRLRHAMSMQMQPYMSSILCLLYVAVTEWHQNKTNPTILLPKKNNTPGLINVFFNQTRSLSPKGRVTHSHNWV